ncbi:MAG: hypothetical protein HON70_21030 [Lentisphaerae bacterium]|nr:hypothetical protein [Lentisphaerota bacterium]
MALFFRGDRSKVKNAALIVETPISLTVAGPMVAGRSPIPKPVVLRPQPSRSDGTSRLQWRIPIDSTTLSRKLNPDSVSWDRYYHVYVTPGTAAPSSFTWRWCIENAGEPGPWHALPGRIVPRLAPGALAPLPAFKLFAQHSSALRLPSREERDDVLDYLFYAGVTGGLALSHYQPELKRIDAELNAAGYFTWAWAWHGYGGPANDGQRLVFAEKARRKRPGVCPQVQADRDEPFWSWLVERYCRPLALDMPWIIINYEPPVFSVCFCPQCRNAFATFAGMAHEAVGKLTPEQLQKLPGDQWGKFRARQNAEVVQTHVAAIRQTDAAIRIGICGPGWVDDIANRGMDIRLFEPDVSLHAPMLYHEPLVYERLVRSTCENTAADVMPFLLASDIAVPRVFPTPADVRINLLATALSGGQGAVLWVGIESLDGEYMNALRRGMEEIRTLEPFMLGGSRRNELCGLPDAGRVRTVKVGAKLLKVPTRNSVSPIRSWGWESERGELLAFINYDEEAPRVMRLGASDADEPRVLFGPVPQREGESLRLTLQPGEFAALVR